MDVVKPAPAAWPVRRNKWKGLVENIQNLLRSRTATTGLVLVLFWVVVAVFADDFVFRPDCWANPDCRRTPLLARHDPYQQLKGFGRQPPSAEHLLGTDKRNRDVWARLAHGARVVLLLAPISVLAALLIGGVLGLIAGYFGGIIDELVMRFLDIMMAFPQILLFLVIIAALGPSALNIVLAITIAGAPGIARLVRSLTLDIKTRDYVAAAQTRGESAWYIMFVEILPNARGPILIDAMLRVGYTVFAISTLGFLGVGLPPPSPDWGSIVNLGRDGLLSGKWWEAVSASLATASLVVGLNLLADGLQEELNRYR
jgi:peptide/nickel transport system permease protein